MNPAYKDSVFTTLFSSPDKIRELYNAIAGSAYDASVEISINTLSGALFLERINDISFTIDNRLVVLIEHQSTVNPNMPLRFLLYIARIYEKIIENKALYKTTLLPIPHPEFYVLYNGLSPVPEEQVITLSAAFSALPAGTKPALELSVKMLNINDGHNREILAKSRELGSYARFIAKVREFMKTLPKEDALKEAIKYCILHDILKDFLKAHASEVENMVLTEYNFADHLAVAREEAQEEGREQILALMDQGYTPAEIRQRLSRQATPPARSTGSAQAPTH